jgi:hypothetical protein
MTMNATVLETRNGSLLVRDNSNRQTVVVHTPMWRNFRRGDRVLILHRGIMTASIPPQITAIRIVRLPACRR